MSEVTPQEQHAVKGVHAFACIALVLGLSFVLQIPSAADFKLFALYDQGSALRADVLWTEGLKPGVDFAYSYGLLPMVVGRGWLVAFGRNAMAFTAYMAVMHFAIAGALAFLVATLRIKWLPFFVFLLALPIAIMPTYLHFTHPLEVTLILLALAFQARNQAATALSLLTVCIFVKPSMAIIFGAIVTAQVLWQRRDIVRTLWKPALVGVVIATALAIIFGGPSLLATAIPLGASTSYKAANFGFFTGIGRLFWWPEQPSLAYYILTPVTIWLLSTLGMLAGVWKASPNRVTLITITLLHVAFVCLFFGYPGSWTYYAYLPILGLALVLDRFKLPTLSFVIAGLVVLGHFSMLRLNVNGWQHKFPYRGTFVYENDHGDFQQALAAVRDHPHLFLTNGSPEILVDKPLTTPRSWFLSPGLQKPAELESLRLQIRAADVVVTHNQTGPLNPWLYRELNEETAAFTPDAATSNSTFTVWRRQAASQPGL